ncbi:hypothetical protein BHE90_001690 [Fusarium euwallaceae]|uniref:Uncharacterized protein n=1 Tax=Fusarium euwallaceae TaxID=1147111 RepID=A0A430M6X8_9HYPO|nr:hypothetical protein BHE90_001690 [Fusarium euwallaceae]
MTKGIVDIVTSQAPTLGVPSLRTSFRKKSREEILNEAHVAINALEQRAGRANRLISIAERIRAYIRLQPDWRYESMKRDHKEDLLMLDRYVDKCLFGDRSVDSAFAKQFDKAVVKYVEGMDTSIAEVKVYITTLEKRLDAEFKAELTSFAKKPIIHSQDTIHVGVPFLRATYSSMSNDEIKDTVHGALKAVERLLGIAKTLALRSLPHFGLGDGPESVAGVIRDMLDNAGDLVLLRGYVDNKLSRTKTVMGIKMSNKRVVSSFMAAKFDRATARLAARVQGHISALERFDSPARPHNVGGGGQTRDVASLIRQAKVDIETYRSLFHRAEAMREVLAKQGDPRAVSVLDGIDHFVATGHAGAWDTLAGGIEGDISRRDGVRVNALGRDFVAKVLETGHDLIKGDISTYRQLNTNLEMILGLGTAEAVARFPVVDSNTGQRNWAMRNGANQG